MSIGDIIGVPGAGAKPPELGDRVAVWLDSEDIEWLRRVMEATERVPGAPRQTPVRSILRAWEAGQP